jgi:L-iditol 2-dehydrogenase
MRLERISDPKPGPGDALIRVRAVGVCGSDVHFYLDGRIGDAVAPVPFTLGHEFAGEIVELGQGADEPPVGTRVAVDPAIPCEACAVCLEGNPNCCPDVRFPAAPPVEGALSELYVHPAHLCVPMPKRMSFAEGALLEPLGVAIHVLTLAKVAPGGTVAILGGGPVGLLIEQLAVRTAGAVYVSEPIPERRGFAERLGATAVCDPDAEDPVEWLLDRTAGHGVDVVIEAAWGGAAVEQAMHMARPAGRVVLVGIPREDVCSFTVGEARRKGLTIRMSRRMKAVHPQGIALAERGVVELESLISHRFGLDEAQTAFELVADLQDGVCKAMIEIQPLL